MGSAPWRCRRLQGLVQQYGVVVGYGGKRENVLNHSNIFVVIIITTINILITISLKICTGYRSCIRLSRSRGFHSYCGHFGLEIWIHFLDINESRNEIQNQDIHSRRKSSNGSHFTSSRVSTELVNVAFDSDTVVVEEVGGGRDHWIARLRGQIRQFSKLAKVIYFNSFYKDGLKCGLQVARISRHVEGEAVSNSRNKVHPTWSPVF